MKFRTLHFLLSFLLAFWIGFFTHRTAETYRDIQSFDQEVNSKPIIWNKHEPFLHRNESFPTFERRPPIYSPSEIRTFVGRATSDLFLVNTSHPFFICMPPKTGSTQMKALVIYVNGGPNYFQRMNKNFLRVHSNRKFMSDFHFQKLDPQQLVDLLPLAPRVLITRNPYVRFLSGYLDWCHRNKDLFQQYSDDYVVNFEGFISMVETLDFQHFNVIENHHIHSITQISDFTNTHYSTILPIEEQDLWYDTFIRKMALYPYISQLNSDGHFFYIPNIHNNSTIHENKLQVLHASPWEGVSNKDGHENNAANKLFQYYTPELARRVFDVHREDFEHFSYPLWDGNPSSFRFV